MAQVAFSFTGSPVIKVTGGASNGTLGASFGSPFLIEGMTYISSLGSKGETVRIKDMRTGGTVMADRSPASLGAGQVWLNEPIAIAGFIMSCPNGIEALIYLCNTAGDH